MKTKSTQSFFGLFYRYAQAFRRSSTYSVAIKISCLALLETLIANYPNITWVPTRVETIHPDELGEYWLMFAFSFFIMMCFFGYQAYYNIYRLRGSSVAFFSHVRLSANLVMMFIFVVCYLGILLPLIATLWQHVAVVPRQHLVTNRGIHVVIYQVLMVGIINTLIGVLSEQRRHIDRLTAQAPSSLSLKPKGTPEQAATQPAREDDLSPESTEAHYQYKILLPTHDRILPIDTGDIAGFYTSDKHTLILMADGRQLEYNKTLQQIMQSLDPDTFFRANKQYIVARGAVKDITVWFDSRLMVTLNIDVPEPIYVPKNKAGEFKQWLVW